MDGYMKGVHIFKRTSTQDGITLIETLVVLSIFLIMINVIPLFFSVFLHDENENALSDQEFQLFVKQLKAEFQKSRSYGVNESHNELYFHHENSLGHTDIVKFEQYGNVLRRRVNDSGHDVFLHRISSFFVQEKEIGIFLTIVSVNGNSFEAYIIHPKSFIRKHVQE
ncbi:hypothetical protein LGQ02_07425 [Bacillus shivajii]|uniref:competence type IV pilus minor pilin ComGF n=1 Tax=Bacillus shivajii TaxID=1983719 RepID=UPI001CF93864|nr:competence type IV pilus minor pilin ComGF [Bacillus shivajii]UCZ54575.1 hypothetical protein LGQ02_07425 [Bacillus shivajii]